MTEFDQTVGWPMNDSIKFPDRVFNIALSSNQILAKISIPKAYLNIEKSFVSFSSYEIYVNRNYKSENVVEFINRVYADVLDGNFLRSDLRREDISCYRALYDFETHQKRKVSLEELNLPTAAEREQRLYEEEYGNSPEFSKPKRTQKGARTSLRWAPEFYIKRMYKAENAPSFIKRVYAPWLDGNFTRADLRHLDPKCANALRDYEKRYGKISLQDLNLPTVKQRNDRLIAAGTLPDDPAERRRLQQVMAQRRNKGGSRVNENTGSERAKNTLK